MGFVDAVDGKSIQTVLVVPRYSTFMGVSSGGGHGPGAGTDQHFVDRPFIYGEGELFTLHQPLSFGIIWGLFAFSGIGNSLDGFAVFASGYGPQWVSPWLLDSPRIPLETVTGEESRIILDHLEDLSTREVGTGLDHDFWSLGSIHTLEIRLDADERRLIRAFVERCRRDLPAQG